MTGRVEAKMLLSRRRQSNYSKVHRRRSWSEVFIVSKSYNLKRIVKTKASKVNLDNYFFKTWHSFLQILMSVETIRISVTIMLYVPTLKAALCASAKTDTEETDATAQV